MAGPACASSMSAVRGGSAARASLARLRAVKITRLAAAALLSVAVSPAFATDAGGTAPFELVRSLELVQNEAADGNASAYAARPRLVAQIAEGLLAADRQAWRDERNARALVIYVLSGGQPSVLRKIMALNALPKADENLLNGTLAYAEGRDEEARDLLRDIDAQSLPPSLGGQLALIQSALLMNEDREKAVTLLGMARLLMPGTLVEDVALRREILVMAERHDVDRFMTLSEQYARRFRRSVYADNFWQSFANTVALITPTIDAQAQRRLENLVGQLGADERRRMFLSIAEVSAVNGNVSLARFVAERAAALCPEGSVEKARAKLYGAAATIVGEDYDAALQQLDAIAKTPLPSRDEQLRQGVLAVAHGLRELPQPVAPAAGEAVPGVKEGSPAAIQLSAAAAAISEGEKRAAEVEQLLKGSP